MRFFADDRAASIAITHALTIGITALLITTLMFGAGEMFDEQQERVIRSGLLDIGDSTVDELTHIDRLAGPSVSKDIVSVVDFPNTVGGSTYTLELLRAPDGTVTLHANTTSPEISVPTVVGADTGVCEAYQNSGPIRVYYDASRDCLTIGGVSP